MSQTFYYRKLFLEPDTAADQDGDPLTQRGQELLYKYVCDYVILVLFMTSKMDMCLFSSERQFNNHLQLARKVSGKYRLEEKKPQSQSERSTTESNDAVTASVLPSNLSNFQPKANIIVKNSDMTTHVMFHGYKDVLAVCDGLKVGLWSLENGSKLGSVDRRLARNPNLSAHYGKLAENVSSSALPSLSRITSLDWINQAGDSLMLTGADDGTVHIWRDNLGDDLSSGSADAGEVTSPNSLPSALDSSSGINRVTPSLAGAFSALTDIATSNRGSGMITDWQQHCGVLTVAGNSETIRLWDVNREQCTRVMHTSTNKCTTAISCQAKSWRSTGGEGADQWTSYGGANTDRGDSSYWSWIFAGFGDGSVAVFDQRVAMQGGRVHSAIDDHHWIVHASIREDVPEVCEFF